MLEVGGEQTRKAIRCPYHSWLYDLDGALKQTSRFGDVPGFCKSDYPLVDVRSQEWHGWVFINQSGDASAFADHVGNLDAYVAPWEPGRLTVAASHEYVVQSNWKTIIENYMECYHCPMIHPALCHVSIPESGEAFEHTGAWTGGPMDLKDAAETQSMDGHSGGVRLRGLSDEQARRSYYFAVAPNVLISPHPDYLMTHRMTPLTPSTTWVECAWLFPPEALELPDFSPQYAVEFWDQTNKEDFAACESVTRAMVGGSYRPGPFAEAEAEVWAAQSMIAQAYATGHWSPPPPPPSGPELALPAEVA